MRKVGIGGSKFFFKISFLEVLSIVGESAARLDFTYIYIFENTGFDTG